MLRAVRCQQLLGDADAVVVGDDGGAVDSVAVPERGRDRDLVGVRVPLARLVGVAEAEEVEQQQPVAGARSAASTIGSQSYEQVGKPCRSVSQRPSAGPSTRDEDLARPAVGQADGLALRRHRTILRSRRGYCRT